jgi:hypothetical protein
MLDQKGLHIITPLLVAIGLLSSDEPKDTITLVIALHHVPP